MGNFAKPAALLVLLSACGPLAETSPLNAIGDVVFDGVMSRFMPSDTAPQSPDREGGMIVRVANLGLTDHFFLAGQNGDKITWMSENSDSITLVDGIMVGTRGFGDDLMGMEGPTRAVLTRDGAHHRRLHEELDGLDQIIRREFACEIDVVELADLSAYEKTMSATRLDEECGNRSFVFVNRYWLSEDGALVQSKQLISPGVGYARIVHTPG